MSPNAAIHSFYYARDRTWEPQKHGPFHFRRQDLPGSGLSPTTLIGVPELLVLPVRHAGPHLRRHKLVLRLLDGATPLVLPVVVPEQAKRRDSAPRLRAHHGQLCRAVLRRITGLEGLGADDIADGKGAADDGGGESALRRATDVGRSPLERRVSLAGLGKRMGLPVLATRVRRTW